MRSPSTLVVVPAYNEEAALASVLAELRMLSVADVVVVDDGSSDRTARVAMKAGVLVVILPFNVGVGGALRTGFRYALRHGYERVVQFDADGQHDAGEIPRLLSALDNGADLVIGSRFADGSSTYEIGQTRWSAMQLLRLLLQILARRRFTDTSSGFRGFSRYMIEYFSSRYPDEYLSDTVEALLLACYGGFRVEEVPVRMRPRAAGSPSHRRVRLLYHYLRLLITLLSSARLRERAVRETES